MARVLAALATVVVLVVPGLALGRSAGASAGCTITQDRSTGGTIATSIEFVNATGAIVLVYWLDYNGVRQLWFRLEAGVHFVQQTFVGHAWVVTDAAGTCIGFVVGEQAAKQYMITGSAPPPPPTPPPPQPKPAAPTIAAFYVSSRPAAPTAGASFTITGHLVLSTGASVGAASLTCHGKVAGAPLQGRGRGGCTFRIPKTAAGKRLAVTVVATYRGKTKTRSVAFTIRRASVTPPTVTKPKPKPSPKPAPTAGSHLDCKLAGARFYGGGAAQAPVCFTLTTDRRTMLEFAFEACPASKVALARNRSAGHVTIKPDGTFSATTSALAAGEVGIGFVNITFSGRIRGDAASGLLVLAAADPRGGSFRCTWSARKAAS